MHSPARRDSRSFTLIELLIVVGIIVILAAIAAENYLTASIRARISRVKVEHRTLQLGIEAYRTDHNRMPRMAHRRYGDARFDMIGGTPVSGVMSIVLSTPIAYVTSAHLYDPFMLKQVDAPLDERMYTYQTIPTYIDWNPDSEFWPAVLEFYGDWRLASVGPDQSFDHLFANSAQLPYDPTNGIISTGNIWTSPKYQEGLPPIPSLLGEH